MLKKLLLCVGVAALAVLGSGAGRAQSGPVQGPVVFTNPCWNPDASVPLTGATCKPLDPPQVSCYVPPDLKPGNTNNFNVIQRASDIFSWQEFIALNWPAAGTERGSPDLTKKLGDPGTRVWETWKEISEVYLEGGAQPPGWNQWPTTPPPPACAAAGVTRVLIRDQKIDDVLDATVQAVAATNAHPATLTDQNNKVVRYEIRMNKVAFDYVVGSGLYNGTTQSQAPQISFPNGAMLVKASWRQVSDAEKSAFHTIRACVCDTNKTGAPVNCQPTQMGLVGLHLTQKTPSAPQWIWSTFEQENNLDSLHGLNASFYNPACSVSACPPNKQTKPTVPNQVTRVIPIPSSDPNCAVTTASVDNVVQLNRDLSAGLAANGSVFQHYQLINTQWPSSSGKPSTVFDVRPAFLSNSTQETFVQETSTCMGCHSTARTVNPFTFVASDFSFSLNNATPKPIDSRVLAAPGDKGVSPWDKKNWKQIKRGYELASRTYELLGQTRQVNAKLHCSSCHLSAGGDPDAAWWVGMGIQYQYDPARLAARINGCFERSMNGLPLCATGVDGGMGECASNPPMNAFIAYMSWLDEQWSGGSFSIPWNGVHPPDGGFVGKDGGQPVNGYPAMPDGGPGDPDAGSLVFQQKCAVCHGSDGQGRYQNGYYRPALWGQYSFNACAGMNKTANSVPFIHANMPLEAGGQLTVGEAWNVATFVDSQCRPGSGGTCPGPSTWWTSPSCANGQSTPQARGAPVKQWAE